VGVIVLPDLVTYPPAVPEVLPGALFGGAAVSSDPGLAAILSFCDVCVRPIGAELVAADLGTLGFPSVGVVGHLLQLYLVSVGTVFFDR